jgi:hypothetical protein
VLRKHARRGEVGGAELRELGGYSVALDQATGAA